MAGTPYCFYFPTYVQGSRSSPKPPDNEDMSVSASNHSNDRPLATPAIVLAVLPDLSDCDQSQQSPEESLGVRLATNTVNVVAGVETRTVKRRNTRAQSILWGLLLLAVCIGGISIVVRRAESPPPSSQTRLGDTFATRPAAPPIRTTKTIQKPTVRR